MSTLEDGYYQEVENLRSEVTNLRSERNEALKCCSQRGARMQVLRSAVHAVAPWLAASLSSGTVCREYAEACNIVLYADVASATWVDENGVPK